jgi:hypothetical protein
MRNLRASVTQAGKKSRRPAALVSAAACALAILGAGALPASAATTTASGTSAVVSNHTWYLYYAWYPTLTECRAVGIRMETTQSVMDYKCLQINRGSYFTWALYLLS